MPEGPQCLGGENRVRARHASSARGLGSMPLPSRLQFPRDQNEGFPALTLQIQPPG